MFCSVQSHQSNPAEHVIQSISNIIIPYITKYGNLWRIMLNMATFCLNIFPINHLQNLSSYEIVYGHKPPTFTDLQLEEDDLTRPTFYHFSDYLDLLNERVHAIRDIVKEHHNQTIQKPLVQHGSESPTLRSFSEGDKVYCHFPSKTIISDIKLLSKKLQCLLLDHCTFSLNMTSSCTSYLQSMGRSLSRHFMCHVSNEVF